MTGILTVMLFTAVVVPNHAIYPGFLPYAPPAVPFPYVPFQRPLPAQPLFAYTVHTAVSPSVPLSMPPSVPQRAAASEVRSFYSPTDNAFQGYSYQTQYQDGGKSEVVFAVGQEAEQIMKKSLEFFDSIIPRDFGKQFNANETGSTNYSSPVVPRIYPNNAFNLFSPPPFFPNTVTSFVNTIVKESTTNGTQVAEEAQESMIHGDVAAFPSPSESSNSISTGDVSTDSRSSASESSTAIDSISSTGSESNSISASITTTAAENIDISAVSATTTAASVPTIISATSESSTTIDSISSTVSESISAGTSTTAAENTEISAVSATTTASSAAMPPPTTTAAQITTTPASSAMTEYDSNDTTRTRVVSISAESSPDSTTIATTAAPVSETTTEGITETTSA